MWYFWRSKLLATALRRLPHAFQPHVLLQIMTLRIWNRYWTLYFWKTSACKRMTTVPCRCELTLYLMSMIMRMQACPQVPRMAVFGRVLACVCAHTARLTSACMCLRPHGQADAR